VDRYDHRSYIVDILKVRDVIRMVEADGWVFVRQTGSHRQYKHPSKPGLVTIAGQAGKDMDVGTYKNVLRQAGLADKEN
jgi:predicted RNA binding protein YcfA (HicA-like mRNA interferase family)